MKPVAATTMSELPTPVSLTQTVQKYGKALLGYIRGKVRSVEDAEDILQDVWYQLSRLSDITQIESMSGWLFFVAKNKITDLYRKRRHDSLEEWSYEEDDEEYEINDILLADESGDPELTLFKEVFWEEFMAAVEELPEKQKLVFIQNELEDKTLQRIADEQQEPLKTIISRKGYALKHLRTKLQYLYNELLP